MAYSIARALALVAPVAAATTVALNVAGASRAVSLGLLLVICALGSLLAVEIDRRRRERRSI